MHVLVATGQRRARDIICAKQLVTEMGFPVEGIIPVHEDANQPSTLLKILVFLIEAKAFG